MREPVVVENVIDIKSGDAHIQSVKWHLTQFAIQIIVTKIRPSYLVVIPSTAIIQVNTDLGTIQTECEFFF